MRIIVVGGGAGGLELATKLGRRPRSTLGLQLSGIVCPLSVFIICLFDYLYYLSFVCHS